MILGQFAERIFKRTYALDEHETWEGCSRRVAKFVANGDLNLEEKFYDIISQRKFIPGGRYLYSAGRDLPSINNCFMLRAVDSREGWADLISKHMKLLSTGGGVGTYYCLDSDTKVLKANLDWVPISKLESGDELVGFEENQPLYKNSLRRTKVIDKQEIIRPTYKINTNRGEVIASSEHKWLVRPLRKSYKKKEQGYRWVTSEKLTTDMEIAFAIEPWQNDYSFDTGWLSGMLDGEGCVSGGRVNGTKNVQIAQKPGPVLERIKSILNDLNIPFSCYDNQQGVSQIYPHGKWNRMKLLGITKPSRLYPKADTTWVGGKLHSKTNRAAKILSIEFLGERKVIGLSTTDKTLIANGFLSHNSDIRPKGSPIKRFGGVASGPISLMRMVNEVAREVMAGGKRRSALLASMDWTHPDVDEFITAKNWTTDIKASKERDFNNPAPLDMMNISIWIDPTFIKMLKDGDKQTWAFYSKVIKNMAKTGEPGFLIKKSNNDQEVLTNPCVSGDTEVLTDKGYFRIDSLLNKKINIWNGEQWSEVTPKITAKNVQLLKINLSDGTSIKCTEYHKWILKNESKIEAKYLAPGDVLAKFEMPIIEGKESLQDPYTQGFLAGDGYERTDFVPSAQYKIKDRLDWLAGLIDSNGTLNKCSKVNNPGYNVQISSVDRLFLMKVKKMLTTLGCDVKVTPGRKEALRRLPDGRGGNKLYLCKADYRIHIHTKALITLINLGLNLSRVVIPNDINLSRSATRYTKVIEIKSLGLEETVYCFNEPHSHRGTFEGVVLGQCGETRSHLSGDVCNLGAIVLPRIKDISELEDVTALATEFLYLGSIRGVVADKECSDVKDKTRRIGLGIMGLHEWLLLNNLNYEPNGKLGKWLSIYSKVSDETAKKVAAKYNDAEPMGRRVVAPTGTTSILAETTSGIEPVFCAAYKRRYLDGGKWKYVYVIDPTVERLVQEHDVDPSSIEDAYSLSKDVERRISMQAYIQDYVDMAISSTINLPEFGEEGNNNPRKLGEILLKYLPRLRGITMYPDGARSGQPITPVKYETAKKHTDVVFEENEENCKGGVCGI